MFEFTKFCKDFYTGCKNPECTYAHSRNEARWGPEYADEDVYYTRPHDADTYSRERIPIPHHEITRPFLPEFIVRIEDDTEEDDEEWIAPSISLTHMLSVTDVCQKVWLREKHRLAAFTREWTMRKAYYERFVYMEDVDMDTSE